MQGKGKRHERLILRRCDEAASDLHTAESGIALVQFVGGDVDLLP